MIVWMFFAAIVSAASAWLTCLSLSFSFSLYVLSLSPSLCLYLAAPGAMANHLITNALLRPHGTNNPYNTLLGDSAVYNNPSVGMYNTQGVLAFFSFLQKCR